MAEGELALKKGEVKDVANLLIVTAKLETAPEGFLDEVDAATKKLLKKLGKTVAKQEKEAKQAEKKAAKVAKLKDALDKLTAKLSELTDG